MIRSWCYFIEHNRGQGAHSIEIVEMGEMRGFNKNRGINTLCHTMMFFIFSPRLLVKVTKLTTLLISIPTLLLILFELED